MNINTELSELYDKAITRGVLVGLFVGLITGVGIGLLATLLFIANV